MIKVYPLKVFLLIFDLGVNLMIDVFMVLEAVDFGGFWLVEGVTDG
jgi:hypothetical protein